MQFHPLFAILSVSILVGIRHSSVRSRRTQFSNESTSSTATQNENQLPLSNISKIRSILGILIFIAAVLYFVFRSTIFNTMTKGYLATPPCENAPHGEQLIGVYGSTFSYSRKITTSFLSSQMLFDQGLVQLFGYNKVEAIRSFESAIEIDSQCAMCYWGIAAANGPNINTVMKESNYVRGREAVQHALELLDHVTDLERDLIMAQAMRYPHSLDAWKEKGYLVCEKEYSEALARVYPEHMHDPDVAVWYAESIINQIPWRYYDVTADEASVTASRINKSPTLRGKPLSSKAYVAFDILYKLLQSSPEKGSHHPLALHLYIHIIEQSDSIADFDGIIYSRRLVNVALNNPAGHLMHMPGHVYLRHGMYSECISTGLSAIMMDEYYNKICTTPYLPQHNIALLCACSVLDGQFDIANEYALSVFDRLSPSRTSSSLVSGLFPIPRELLYVRFGLWSDILDLNDIPKNESQISSYYKAVQIYAHCLALIGIKQYTHAKSYMKLLDDEIRNIGDTNLPPSHIFYSYHSEMGHLMNITATASLNVAMGNFDDAIKALEDAVSMQSQFSYMEPEHFYIPLRQCLGAVLLHKAYSAKYSESFGQYLLSQARDAFQVDLTDHPNNIWAIKGLSLTDSATEYNNVYQSNHAYFAKKKSNRLIVNGPCCEVGLC
jgi:tetratricopeptide (TPR) repeat protein